MPAAYLEGAGHSICYVNPAFCLFLGKPEEELTGKALAAVVRLTEECAGGLDRVYRSGSAETLADTMEADDGVSGSSPLWSWAIWPVHAAADSSPSGVMIQKTETEGFRQRVAAMNEALLLDALRQHETAEKLNLQLKAEAIERERAFEALVRAEKLSSLGRMIAALAHEINNPLEAVMNALYLARTSPAVPEIASQYMEIAENELNRVSHMTRQTLGFYREPSTPTTFSVASLLESAAALVQAKIQSTHATIEKQFDTGLQVTAYRSELRQVFSNLILNSLDAVGKDGKIVVRISAAGAPAGTLPNQEWVRILVADNGTGISAAAKRQIFEPFFTTKGSTGTGLGLWVSKQIVEKHGGSIRVCSSTVGSHRGTTFSVMLPVHPTSLEAQ
jgi:signal transduction histidine kinase